MVIIVRQYYRPRRCLITPHIQGVLFLLCQVPDRISCLHFSFDSANDEQNRMRNEGRRLDQRPVTTKKHPVYNALKN